ncbi:hypothetical protein Q8A67_015050 [Cirrhinus molitorella]|uniref:Uncharacterized protein n=1 Tax=Cirrhinus molitorella TaxID=172907 RepID=A0AA88TKB8_9TELE|nr:hypothetical protein Q8A67_015050 [Cirrhinus molitorella]
MHRHFQTASLCCLKVTKRSVLRGFPQNAPVRRLNRSGLNQVKMVLCTSEERPAQTEAEKQSRTSISFDSDFASSPQVSSTRAVNKYENRCIHI